MYYDAGGTDYISTPSFAIPNTGILTIEAWIKSKNDTLIYQTVLGEGTQTPPNGYLYITR